MKHMKHYCVKGTVHIFTNISEEAGHCVRHGPVLVHEMQSFAIDVQTMLRKEMSALCKVQPRCSHEGCTNEAQNGGVCRSN